MRVTTDKIAQVVSDAPQIPLDASSQSDLWAITSYFNPMRYQHRRINYDVFRSRLDLPLVTVELAYGPDFDLDDTAADVVIRRRGSDVMWQKERLLNIALDALPATCRKVAWLDCDIVFGSADWAAKVSSALDQFALVQAFSHVHHMPRDLDARELRQEFAEFTRLSAVAGIAMGSPPSQCLGEDVLGERFFSYSRGYAWAGRLEVMKAVGFFDANIVGGGDRAMACAAFGHAEEAVQAHRMTAAHERRYLSWAEKFDRAVGGSVGSIDCHLFHLWHGEAGNRRATERHACLNSFDFDPFTDIALDAGGCWRWASSKPGLHAYLREYFAQRREDG